MASYNTSFDAANTAVRAFLTKVGEYYYKSSFNTTSGKGKKVWDYIRDEVFAGACAYCGTKEEKLQIEHLVMFNREQFGLHHPGNIVPTCSNCNKRRKDEKKQYLDWEGQLETICRENDDLSSFFARKKRIKQHVEEGEFRYPDLNEAEQNAIRVIASSLYENIKSEGEKALDLYRELDTVFGKGQTPSPL